MKKLIVLVLFFVVSITLPSYVIIKKAGRAGNAGSPGETACNNCHNDFAINTAGGSIQLTTDIPADQYAPSTVYHLSVKVKRPGQVIFGFGLEALDPSNTNAGVFTVTDVPRTQVLTAANTRKSMTHKLNGGLSNDSAVFNFDWTSPATNVGNITFYYSGVCGNNSNNDAGDYAYKGTYLITPSSIFAAEENQPFSGLRVIPTMDNQSINLHFLLNEDADIWLNLLTLDGKQITQASYFDQEPGQKNFEIITQGLNTGVYIVQARINETNISRKFLLVQ